VSLTDAEKAARAARIKDLLDHPEVKAAFAYVEDSFIGEWRRAQTSAERENMWLALQIVERVRTWMLSTSSGDLTAIRRQSLGR
jgi:hypothetical protein